MNPPELNDTELALLAEFIDGNRDARDPEVSQLLTNHPELREEVDNIAEIAQQLDSGGREARSEIAASLGHELDSEDRRIAEQVFGSIPRKRERAWLIAAAVLIASSIVYWRWSGDPSERTPENETVLSTHGASDGLSPFGRVSVVDKFSWPETPQPGDAVRIELRAPPADAFHAPFLISPSCEGSSWVPTPDELTRVRAESHFIWRRILEAADGGERVLDEVEVWQ